MHGDFFARVAEIKTVSRAVYLASQKEFGLTAARLRTTLTSHTPSSLHFGIIARGGTWGEDDEKEEFGEHGKRKYGNHTWASKSPILGFRGETRYIGNFGIRTLLHKV